MFPRSQRSAEEVVWRESADGNAIRTYANVAASAVSPSECPTLPNTKEADTQTQSPEYLERNFNTEDASKYVDNTLKTDAESQTELLVLPQKADMAEFSSQTAPSKQSSDLSTKCLKKVSTKKIQTLPLESFKKLYDEIASIFQGPSPEFRVKILTREAASKFLPAGGLVKDAFESAPEEFVSLGSLLPENTDKVGITQMFLQDCLEKASRKRAGLPKSFGKVHKSAQGSSSRCFVKSHGQNSNGASPGNCEKAQKVASKDSSKVNYVKANIAKCSSYKRSAHRSYVIPLAKKADSLNSSPQSNTNSNAKRRSKGSQSECFVKMRVKNADSQDYPDSFGDMTLTLKGLVLGGFRGALQIKVKKVKV